MKKAVLVILFSFVFIFGAFAARTNFYFDAGLGLGKGKTTWGNYDLADSEVKELGIEIGGKFGFAPVRKFPFFIVLDLDWAGHRFSYDDGDYEQFASMLFGPGLIFYPNSLLQLAATVGISEASYRNSWSDDTIYYESGTGWSVSAAFDIGGRRSGALLGVKYMMGFNDIYFYDPEEAIYYKVTQKNSVFSIFARFVLRRFFSK